jgi:hypothetical protein
MKTTTIAAIGVVVLVLLGFVVAPAMAANADNDLYTSKYAAIPNDTPLKGILKGNLRAGFALDQTIIAYGPETVKMTAGDDGTFEATLLPGQYTLVLADGNGGQTEFSSATIAAGQISYPEREILGHAISVLPEQPDVIEILDAQYGAIEQRCEQVLVTPAQPAVPEHFEYVGHNKGDYDKFCGQYYYVGHHHGDYKKHAAVPAKPAVYKTVCTQYGSMIDVTAQVRAAVDAGHRQMMFFDNAQNPGGLFVEGGLFAEIEDPAYGIVKDVVINYKLNGVAKQIVTKEYEEIKI